ncbi:hypothetical protein HJG54_24770 [Leptolyngbya sp. NK1-12]|uniref:Uncharacterized protein n=1 Tax=Leptolyngbya sp. NK1-12 TaxID=2547451 RepID=A0AA96WHQ2_9CYAN|nr:hypothetical protein [Leptolyngbya sp. NK1-12]WNZ25733.1 hypothetical protein HJG54_24770 [Leptolyngbya sp. NK1-12]
MKRTVQRGHEEERTNLLHGKMYYIVNLISLIKQQKMSSWAALPSVHELGPEKFDNNIKPSLKLVSRRNRY